MDLATLNMLINSILTGAGAAKTALEVRDFNATGAALSQLTQEVLDLQGSLLTVNAAFFELQQDHRALTQKVRELEEERADRERYALFEISPQVFVYRVNVSPEEAGSITPGLAEPLHYACQRCWAEYRVRVVLQRRDYFGSISLACEKCGTNYPIGESGRSLARPRATRHDDPWL